MTTFRDKVREYIAGHNLIKSTSDLILVALSGGADSVALLAVLTELGYPCRALHCNFHLRGEESNRDCQHAVSIANQLGVHVDIVDFDVYQYIVDSSNNLSVEMACRELRYDWFSKKLTEYGASAIAVAHNADDNIETLMLNLVRGTGITGLRGMRPLNENKVIRPLLGITRTEIERYLKERKLGFIVDSTNLESVYRRNAIRNEVLPKLYASFPQAKAGITQSIHNLAENSAVYEYLLKEKLKEYSDEAGCIYLAQLVADEPYCSVLLYEWLRHYGFSRETTDNMIVCHNKSGCRFECGEYVFIIDRGVLRQQCFEFLSHDIDELFEINVYPIDQFVIHRNSSRACFDVEVLNGESLTARYWQNGDKMKPFGMKGHKKLSDIFNDAKISISEKSRVPLLVKGNDILWVSGVRQSDKYRVNPASTHFVEITLRNNK